MRKQTEKTAQLQAQQAKAANVEYVLNSDAGGGTLGRDGKPIGYAVSGAEKSYVDFEMTVTNPGGHSSVPRPDNAIYSLTRALNKIADYQFAPQINEITRVSLTEAGKHEPGPLGTALAAFAANSADAAAAATISRNPERNAQIRTTCVTTQLSGGHAPNALPQRATANVNCRLFPGVSISAAKAILTRVIDDGTIKITQIGDFPATDASPLRTDVLSAVAKAVHERFPGVSVVPGMDRGQTDSIFYRALGIPSYGVSGVFIKDTDNFIHGLNERIPSDAVAPVLAYWHSLLTNLTD